MKILSLDLSTSTGYAILENSKLLDYGIITRKIPEFKMNIVKYTDYPESYPNNFIKTAILVASDCMKLLKEHKPDLVVIEETNLSRQRFSQKALEFIHFSVCTTLMKHKQEFKYLTQTCWRQAVGAYATAEDKKMSAKASRYRKKNNVKIAVIDGKIYGKKTSKHHSVRVANELFGLDLILKDNDIADAINLAVAGERIYGK